MKNRRKQWISIFLAVCIFTTIIPLSVFGASPSEIQEKEVEVAVATEPTSPKENETSEAEESNDRLTDESTDEPIEDSQEEFFDEQQENGLEKLSAEDIVEDSLLKEESQETVPVATGAREGAVSYYLDASAGDDDFDGMSPETAWKSLAMINEIVLEPGDRVLLKAGEVFEGSLSPKGSGTIEAPVIFDMYDEETIGIEAGVRPHIKGDGRTKDTIDSNIVSYGLWIKNESHIQVNNLEISNQGAERQLSVGVCVEAVDYGVMSDIHLNNLYIHDVNGTMLEKTVPNGGIYFVTTEAGEDTRFDNISVQNCSVKNVSRTGISVGFSESWEKWDGNGGRIPQEILDAYGHTNVVIRNNYVENAGGDAIVPMFSIEPLVEYNISNEASQNTKTHSMYNAGIWPWRCEDALFQFNEVYGTILNGDGQAYDCDFSRGTTYQYNYSHDNEGGFMLICQAETLESVVRYNVSQNDMRCLFLVSNSNNADIYNNTLYVGEGLNTNIVEDYGGVATLKNNIFYNLGSTKTPNWGRNFSYDNNLYYGYTTTPDDSNKIIEDPLFVQPGSGATGTEGNSAIHTLDGYALIEGSPAIDAGVDIPNNGGRDYAGNPIGESPTDIGAFESTVVDVFVRSEVYKIDHRLRQIVLDDEVEYQEFIDNITYTEGASVMIQKDGEDISTGTITDGVTVTVAKEELSKEYTVIVERVYPAPHIQSEVYVVDDRVGRIYIEQATDYTEFTENIQTEKHVTYRIMNGDSIVTDGMVEPNFTVEVTSGEQTKTYTVHLIVVKEKYHYANDFVGGLQGPVWYNEYFENSERKLFTEWVEEWNCWVALSNLLTAGLEEGKGLIAPTRGGETAFTWVAPKDGTIEIGQAHFAYLRRQWQGSGTMGFHILHNEDTIFPSQGEVLLQAKSELFVRPLIISVSKGDQVSFVTTFKGGLTDSSTYFTPTVSYIEEEGKLTTDITGLATISASSTEAGYSTAGLTDNNISQERKERQWKAAGTDEQWLSFDFQEKQNIAQLVFVGAAGETLQSDIKCSFDDGTSLIIEADEINLDKGYSIITLPEIKNTAFVRLDFIDAVTAPVLGEVQVLSQVSLAELIALYEANKNLVESNYTPENWIVFTAALNNAKALIDNPKATQEDVDSALRSLQFAVDSLQRLYQITVENGVAAVEKAKAGDTVLITADPAPQGYTFEKWTSDDISFADSTAASTSFVMPEKEVSISAVYKVKQLVERTVHNAEHTVSITAKMSDTTEIEVEGKTIGDYPEIGESLSGYEIQKVLDIKATGPIEGEILIHFGLEDKLNGKKIIVKYQLSDGTILTREKVCTDGKIILATESLGAYVLAVKSDPSAIVDKTLLGQWIAKAKEHLEEEYTPESWTVFFAKLENAKEVFSSSKATQQQVDEATNALQLAMESLIEKQPSTPDSKPTPPSSSTTSSRTYETLQPVDKKVVGQGKTKQFYVGGKGLPKPGETIVGDTMVHNDTEAIRIMSAAPKVNISREGNPSDPQSKAAEITRYSKEQFLRDWKVVLENKTPDQKAAVIRGINYSAVEKEVLDYATKAAEAAGITLSFQFDEIQHTAVVKRTYQMLENSNATVTLLRNAAVERRITDLFNKFFKNSIMVVSAESKEAATKVAIHLPQGTETQTLTLYHYSIETNSYKKLGNNSWQVDANGYLHVALSEDALIISQGPLEK